MTTARTRSPVVNPWTWLGPLALLQGNPNSSTLTFWRDCRPLASTSQGQTCWSPTCAGVEAPQRVASTQCAFERFLFCLFHLVRPPEPVSSGNPSVLSRSYIAHLVLFTTAASLRGLFTGPGCAPTLLVGQPKD